MEVEMAEDSEMYSDGTANAEAEEEAEVETVKEAGARAAGARVAAATEAAAKEDGEMVVVATGAAVKAAVAMAAAAREAAGTVAEVTEAIGWEPAAGGRARRVCKASPAAPSRNAPDRKRKFALEMATPSKMRSLCVAAPGTTVASGPSWAGRKRAIAEAAAKGDSTPCSSWSAGTVVAPPPGSVAGPSSAPAPGAASVKGGGREAQGRSQRQRKSPLDAWEAVLAVPAPATPSISTSTAAARAATAKAAATKAAATSVTPQRGGCATRGQCGATYSDPEYTRADPSISKSLWKRAGKLAKSRAGTEPAAMRPGANDSVCTYIYIYRHLYVYRKRQVSRPGLTPTLSDHLPLRVYLCAFCILGAAGAGSALPQL